LQLSVTIDNYMAVHSLRMATARNHWNTLYVCLGIRIAPFFCMMTHLAKRYGFTPSETREYLQAEERIGVECGPMASLAGSIEAWRRKHGWPCDSSPLTCGYVLDLVRDINAGRVSL
jgi:hypothetical protein